MGLKNLKGKATEKQIKFMENNLIDYDLDVSKQEAYDLISKYIKFWKSYKPKSRGKSMTDQRWCDLREIDEHIGFNPWY